MSQLREEQVLLPESRPGPAEAAERQELGERVWKLLDHLPVNQARSSGSSFRTGSLTRKSAASAAIASRSRLLDPRRDQDAAGSPVRRPGGQGSQLRRTRHDL